MENSPVTKAELKEALQGLEDRIDGKLDTLESRVDGKLDALEQRIDDKIEKSALETRDLIRQIETNLLTAFHSYANGVSSHFKEVDVTTASLKERMNALEDRMNNLEFRIRPGH